MAEGVSPKYTERLVREALEGVGVESQAKAKLGGAQLEALVVKLGALLDEAEVNWCIPSKLLGALSRAGAQEQNDLRWAVKSRGAGLPMGSRSPPSDPAEYTPPRVKRAPTRANQPEQRFRKDHPRSRSPPKRHALYGRVSCFFSDGRSNGLTRVRGTFFSIGWGHGKSYRVLA